MSAMAAGGGGAAGRKRKAALPGLCWKTCYVPFVLWVVSVCGEDRTLMVEVGIAACTHLHAKPQCARKLPAHLVANHHFTPVLSSRLKYA